MAPHQKPERKLPQMDQMLKGVNIILGKSSFVLPVAHCAADPLPAPEKPVPAGMTLKSQPAPASQPPTPPPELTVVTGRTNPGAFEEAQGPVRKVLFQDNFDGLRFDLAKPMNQQFALTHSILMGSSMIPGGSHYAFGANLMDGGHMLSGRMDWNGRLQGTYVQMITDSLKMKAQAMLTPDPSAGNVEMDFEQKGSDYTGTLKIAQGWVFGATYNQAITKYLSMGGAGYYIGTRNMSAISTGLRYKTPDFTALASYSSGSGGTLTAQYARHVSPKVNLASELVYSLRNRETQLQLGYQFTLHQTRLSALVKSDGTISAVMEEHLAPGFALLFSSVMDHFKGAHKFGFGLQLGQ